MSVPLNDDPEAHRYDIYAIKGEDFHRELFWYDSNDNEINLNSATAGTMKVAKLYPATDTTAAYSGPLVVNINTSNGVTLGGVNSNEIDLLVDQSIIDVIAADTYNYQVIVTMGGINYLIVRGEFKLEEKVI